MNTLENRAERKALGAALIEDVEARIGLPLLKVEIVQLTAKAGKLTRVVFRSRMIPTDGSPEGAEASPPDGLP